MRRCGRGGAARAAMWALCAAGLVGFATARPAEAQRLRAELITDAVERPTWVGAAPGDHERLFIIERASGLLKIFKDGQILPTPFLDISGNLRAHLDGGFMCMAFHPDFVDNKIFYIYYTDAHGDAVVDRYQVSNDPNVADASSRFEILKVIRDPLDDLHAGGTIEFGPNDGYLYITCGDGGPQGDPFHHAQDPRLMLGKILRIDVDGGSPYSIPADNPFVNDPGTLDEIWAIGFRNPWRTAFDPQTGDLYIGDVGYATWEEVDFIADGDGGRNYGWAVKEGSHCLNPPENCDPNGRFVDPITDYPHGGTPRRCCVIGGRVYRGEAIPLLDGHYFFADYCSGQVTSVLYDGQQIVETLDHSAQLHRPDGNRFISVSTFGTDADGEMFVVDHLSGVYRIVTEMHLEVPTLVAGQQATFTVTGATPAGRVAFLYSRTGTGQTRVPMYDVTLALRQPQFVALVTADADGRAMISGTLPPGSRGRTLWLQAAEIGNTSDVSRRVVE